MTEQLKQAAQQALEALQANFTHYGDPLRCSKDAITALRRALTTSQPAQAGEVDGSIAAALSDIVAVWDQHAPAEYMTAQHMQAKRALAGQQPVSPDMHGWCAYVGGMVAHWVTSEPDAHARLGDERFEAAIAGIIKRRLWAMPKPTQPTQAGEVGERQVLCGEDIEELAIFHAPPIHPDFKNDDDFIEFGRAIERKVIQRLSASLPTQPAAQAGVHPLASRCYTMSESHLSGFRLILGFETMEAAQAAHTWVANLGKPAAQATPEPVRRNDPLSALAIRILVDAGHVSQADADSAFTLACEAMEDEAQRMNVELPWVVRKAAVTEPVPMVLHCPKCGMQHIDGEEWEDDPHDIEQGQIRTWKNEPHRSHLCHGCGTIWRPADVPTTGVKAISTKGKADTWVPGQAASPEPVGEPWGWAIEDKHGVAQAIRPARKEFFGCVQSTDPFTAEDIAKMDREWSGIAPHHVVTLYTRPAPGVPEGLDEDQLHTVERAADLLEHYAAYINEVKPDDIERHPYVPEIELTAADLRVLSNRGGDA